MKTRIPMAFKWLRLGEQFVFNVYIVRASLVLFCVFLGIVTIMVDEICSAHLASETFHDGLIVRMGDLILVNFWMPYAILVILFSTQRLFSRNSNHRFHSVMFFIGGLISIGLAYVLDQYVNQVLFPGTGLSGFNDRAWWL